MDNTSKNKVIKSNEFDYFYVLIKSWKIILLSCLIFFIIGLIYIFITPNVSLVKSTFSIALNEQITTSYGKYNFKTVNPLYYLRALEQKQFVDSVLAKNESKDLNFSFKVEADEDLIKTDPRTSVILPPDKFDFTVAGVSKQNKLVEINESAIDLFLKETDKNIQDDMFNMFSTRLKAQIDSTKLSMQVKENFISELRESLKGSVQIRTDKTIFKELVDDRLINSLKGSERGLIIAMMLNGDKGNQYYQEVVLSVEEVQLKLLANTLEKYELLLSKLNKSKEEGTLDELFKKPFSSNYILLTPPEIQDASSLSSHLKKILIFLFLGLFLSSSVVLMRSYYKMMYSGK